MRSPSTGLRSMPSRRRASRGSRRRRCPAQTPRPGSAPRRRPRGRARRLPSRARSLPRGPRAARRRRRRLARPAPGAPGAAAAGAGRGSPRRRPAAPRPPPRGRLGLVEDRLDAALRLGAGRQVIGELEELVLRHPVGERLWELLLTALYRAGRQSDALAAYQRVKQQLSEELGLDPGPGLRRLEAQILAQDAALEAPHGAGAQDGAGVPNGNLPSLSTALVGRTSELALLSRLLRDERLVEIVGPGGVGKTALAVEVGRRLQSAGSGQPGGVWLARLEHATNGSDVVDVLIAAMDVAGGEAALFERLRSLEAVLVLDNCEHVVDAAADLVTRVLDAAPGVRVLCTSQVPLYVDGETVVDLGPLALPDAVELFTRRAAAQRPSDPP